uniref:Uncharacterized protein n=1 Tax=Ananas comosus var. bracteatus TaxID=296719 RepID=A0A6V7PQY4_ANACO|nr:unnamed protein product [Ananas comosus var. bracteatus]
MLIQRRQEVDRRNPHARSTSNGLHRTQPRPSSSSSSSSPPTSSPSTTSPHPLLLPLPITLPSGAAALREGRCRPSPQEFSAFTSPQPCLRPQPQPRLRRPPAPRRPPLPALPGLLSAFLSYPVNGSCPDDELPAQKAPPPGLRAAPQAPLPPAAPPTRPAPPLPDLPLVLPPDRSVLWTAYSCKNFACLVHRKHSNSFDDCKDCFDLHARERHRWVTASTNPLDFAIDEVLARRRRPVDPHRARHRRRLRTFAVRMRERNVTVVATTMNLNGPSPTSSRRAASSRCTSASRSASLLRQHPRHRPLHARAQQLDTHHAAPLHRLRHLPCFEARWCVLVGPFLLRGGADGGVCGVIESVGFKKLKWEVGRKLDRGPELKEMYISALLEKPLKNSW